jgi:hypothetical protein
MLPAKLRYYDFWLSCRYLLIQIEVKMDNHIDNISFEEINLLDIWKKIIQYKKIFWSVFFAVFIIGGTIAISTPPKYSFSQVVEIGQLLDREGQSTLLMAVDSAVIKIKKVFYPEAMRAYNLQVAKKTYGGKENLMVEKAGDSTLLLSINGKLMDSDKYKIILQKVVDNFVNDTSKYIDQRKSILNNSKLSLENRLNELQASNNFLSQKQNGDASENKMISMYFYDKNAIMIQLMNNISLLQTQIFGTYNTRATSDMVVSDSPVGLSKYVLLFFVFVGSFFSAFFGVFIKNFIANLKNK